MVVSFKDGTSMTLPNGREARSFLQFDLPWLVYIHGKVTSINADDDSTAFQMQRPRETKSTSPCKFC